MVAEKHNRREEQVCGENMKIIFKVTEACSIQYGTKDD